MNEEMRKKLAEINATKAEVRQLIADGKLDEAESKKAELDALQRAFNLLLSMEDEDEAAAKAQAKKKQELHDEKQPPADLCPDQPGRRQCPGRCREPPQDG